MKVLSCCKILSQYVSHRIADSRSIALIGTSPKVTQKNLQEDKERLSFSLNPNSIHPLCFSHGSRAEHHMARALWKHAALFRSAMPALFFKSSSVFENPDPNRKFRLSLRHCFYCSRARSNRILPVLLLCVF